MKITVHGKPPRAFQEHSPECQGDELVLAEMKRGYIAAGVQFNVIHSKPECVCVRLGSKEHK